jgi:hypothetical protein
LIVLDENILDGQRVLLEAWRLAPRQIGVDLGRKGLKDEQIIVLLRKQLTPTFFTRDAGFYRPNLKHRSYCVVLADVGQNEVATFIRRFLRHPGFNTRAKRMGRIVRISHVGITFWAPRTQVETHTAWTVAK